MRHTSWQASGEILERFYLLRSRQGVSGAAVDMWCAAYPVMTPMVIEPEQVKAQSVRRYITCSNFTHTIIHYLAPGLLVGHIM